MPKTKAFIEKARAKHGDRYDYSKVVYVRTDNKVTILCMDHGYFWQTPNNHLRGQGCGKCAGKNRTTPEWIDEAKKMHGDLYDYSKTVYISSHEKVTIACREHGDFEQTPNHHLRGYGCRKCAGTHSYSTLEWIDRAREKHGDIYGYYRTMYIGSKCKVIITCKEHGDFEQWPANHLMGDGCSACSYVSNGDRFRHSDAEFIERARVTHGDLYNYSKVDYIRSSSKVIITCKKHGDFEQAPASHLAGNGCSKCSGLYNYTTPEWIVEAKNTHGDKYDYGNTVYVRALEKVIITCKKHGDFENIASQHLHGAGCQKCAGKHRYSTVEWVDAALLVHGDLYDYSKTVYVRNSDKVVITCKEHGDFDQTPANHLSGSGCQRCNWNRDQSTEMYLMKMGSQVKIGISIDPEKRLAQLNRNNPKPAHIITTWTLEDFPAAYAMEQRIHRKLKAYHAGLTGFDGATEWFNTTPENAEMIINKLIGSGFSIPKQSNTALQLELI